MKKPEIIELQEESFDLLSKIYSRPLVEITIGTDICVLRTTTGIDGDKNSWDPVERMPVGYFSEIQSFDDKDSWDELMRAHDYPFFLFAPFCGEEGSELAYWIRDDLLEWGVQYTPYEFQQHPHGFFPGYLAAHHFVNWLKEKHGSDVSVSWYRIPAPEDPPAGAIW